MLDMFFRKYAWTAELALLFVAALFTARIVNTLVGAVIRPRPHADLSAPAAGPRQAPGLTLDNAKLYHLIGEEPPAGPADVALQAPRRPQNCADPAAQSVKSELRLSLVAGVLAEVPRYSLATIASAGGHESQILGVGDRIGNAEVLGLEWVRTNGDISGNAFELVAVICNDGTKEYVEPDSSIGGGNAYAPVPRPVVPPPAGTIEGGARSVGPNQYDIDRQVLDSTLSDSSQITTQAQIVPSFKNGVANGVSVFAIQPDALLAAIGVEDGDVIQRVNGYKISPLEKTLELYQRLRKSSHASIDLERDGQPVRLEYNIKDP